MSHKPQGLLNWLPFQNWPAWWTTTTACSRLYVIRLAAYFSTSSLFDCEYCVMIITKGTNDFWSRSQDWELCLSHGSQLVEETVFASWKAWIVCVFACFVIWWVLMIFLWLLFCFRLEMNSLVSHLVLFWFRFKQHWSQFSLISLFSFVSFSVESFMLFIIIRR